MSSGSEVFLISTTQLYSYQGHVVQISIKSGNPKSNHTVAKSVNRYTSFPDFYPNIFMCMQL